MRGRALAVVLLLACASDQADWEARYDAIVADADRRAVVDLPDVDGAPGSDDDPRLVIAGGELVLDASRTVARAYPGGDHAAAALPPAPRVVGHLGTSIGLAPPPVPVARLRGLEVWASRGLDARSVLEVLDRVADTYGVRRAYVRVARGLVPIEVGRPEPDPDIVTLELAVDVRADGLMLSGSGGPIFPGCERAARDAPLTIPDAAGALDLPTLSRCLRSIHDQFPDETSVLVTAPAGVSHERVSRVLAAIAADATHGGFPAAHPSAQSWPEAEATPGPHSTAGRMAADVMAATPGS